MRYIGNKRKLLDFIGDVIAECGIAPGRAVDAFAGTASVGRELKRRGFAVQSCDIMTYSYVFQRAYVEVDAAPTFEGLFAEPAVRAAMGRAATPLEGVLRHLGHARSGSAGFISRHYAPAERSPGGIAVTSCAAPGAAGTVVATGSSGDEENGAIGGGEAAGAGRMFFTPANAARIDAIRTALHEWDRAGCLTSDEYYVLLAALLESADAVANTTGVYAAYVKSWQPNALRDLALRPPPLLTGTGLRCRARQGDAREALLDAGPIDLLYLDPPYNGRQYRSYYHVPEIIARGWFDEAPEPRGKTGLIGGDELSSVWSTRGGCVDALDQLLAAANARWILLSYNSEGLIPQSEIERLFRDHGRASTYRVYDREYARYRADREHAGRRFAARRVTERIHVVQGRRPRGAGRGAI